MSDQNSDDSADDKPKRKQAEIIAFPTQAEREQRQKQEEAKAQERIIAAQKAILEARRAASGKQPFINTGKLSPFSTLFVGVLILVYLLQYFFMSSADQLALTYQWGFTPSAFTKALSDAANWHWRAALTPFSYAFLHGGWMHLIFNGVMLLALGTFFERQYGTQRIFVFFMVCSLGGALTYMAFSPFSDIPVIGASGGISGLFSATLILMLRQGYIRMSPRFGFWPVLIFWGIFLFAPGLLLGEPVSWQSHLGGYVMGIALFLGFGKRTSR